MNEYQLVCETGLGKGIFILYYCPFCGGAAPKSRRGERFARITNEELARLRNLTAGLDSLSDVIAALGTPDRDDETGVGLLDPEKEGSAPVAQYFRTLVYERISETVVVRAIERPNHTVHFTYTGKYLGSPPGEST